MIDMPRPRPPHLHRERGRWIVRIGHGPRVKIKSAYGSPEFGPEYDAAITLLRGDSVEKPGKASLKWLWERYRETAAWLSLSAATRKQRENIMRGVLEKAGSTPYVEINRKSIVASRDARAATPAMARHFVDTMRGLFRWALDAEHIDDDPTRDVDAPKPKTDGHHTWTRDEITAFHALYAVGTRERLAFDLILFTGLRRGDVVQVGRQHIRNGVLTIKTEKTGETARIEILPLLATTIAAGPCGDLHFIVGERGEPMTKESFGNWFGSVCRDAGFKGTAHGLRKALATILAEEGASSHELEALFAWRGGGMASLYTRKANRDKLARAAIGKIEHKMDALFPQQGESSHTQKTIEGNQ